MFYIRADANRTIATGHIMRCVGIAKQIQHLGEPCTFITADNEGRELILNNGFEIECLNSKWNYMEDELDKLIALIHKKNIKVLLLDSYSVTETYLKVLSKVTNVIYLDDLNKFPYPVHTVINYGIQAEQVNYEKTAGHYMLGCHFIPLRQEFSQHLLHTADTVEQVLITTGGTDPFNMAGKLIEALKESGCGCHLHVVSGRLNIHWAELKNIEKRYDDITVYSNVHNMGELMSSCDLAVSAAGTTLYELCAIGVPTISFTFADNQVPGAIELHSRNIIDYAGDVRNDTDQCVQQIKKLFYQLKENYNLREEKRKCMQSLVDGQGADRIATYCIQLQREELK